MLCLKHTTWSKKDSVKQGHTGVQDWDLAERSCWTTCTRSWRLQMPARRPCCGACCWLPTSRMRSTWRTGSSGRAPACRPALPLLPPSQLTSPACSHMLQQHAGYTPYSSIPACIECRNTITSNLHVCLPTWKQLVRHVFLHTSFRRVEASSRLILVCYLAVRFPAAGAVLMLRYA